MWLNQIDLKATEHIHYFVKAVVISFPDKSDFNPEYMWLIFEFFECTSSLGRCEYMTSTSSKLHIFVVSWVSIWDSDPCFRYINISQNLTDLDLLPIRQKPILAKT